MTLATQMNSRVNEWPEAARGQVENAALTIGKQLQRGLKAAARGAGRAAHMTDRIAAISAELSSIAIRGSRELAASNLTLSRELLLAAQKRLEQAATADSVGAVLRGQVASWPATREHLRAGFRAYRDRLGKTAIDLQRATVDAIAGAKATKSAGAPKRRRRSSARTTTR
jgi:hypothetical protein